MRLPVECGVGYLLDMIGRIEEGIEDLIELMLHDGGQVLERELNGVGEQLLGVEAHLCQVHVLLEKEEKLCRVGQPVGQHALLLQVVGVQRLAHTVHYMVNEWSERMQFVVEAELRLK